MMRQQGGSVGGGGKAAPDGKNTGAVGRWCAPSVTTLGFGSGLSRRIAEIGRGGGTGGGVWGGGTDRSGSCQGQQLATIVRQGAFRDCMSSVQLIVALT